MSTDALRLPGAVAEQDRPAVAAHFGSPPHEQRALIAGRAVVVLPDHGVVAVAGPDRLRLLDSLTSQSLAGLAPGVGAESLLLDPHGRIEQVLRVLDDGTTAWLLLDPGRAEAVAGFFDRMRFMLDVRVSDESARFVTVGAFAAADDPEALADAAAVLGGRAQPALALLDEHAARPAGEPLIWRDPWPQLVPGGWQYAPAAAAARSASGWRYREALVEHEALPGLLDELEGAGVAPAGLRALTALRIEAHRPSAWTELDERAIPHEFDWLRSAVHLDKGCYRGQETVAKVHNLGHPPRRLVMLHLDGSVEHLPEHGDIVWSSDAAGQRTKAGLITVAARHHELGPIALALLKRSVPVDETLTVVSGPEDARVDIAAAQEVIVPPDAGALADVPRLPRLG